MMARDGDAGVGWRCDTVASACFPTSKLRKSPSGGPVSRPRPPVPATTSPPDHGPRRPGGVIWVSFGSPCRAASDRPSRGVPIRRRGCAIGVHPSGSARRTGFAGRTPPHPGQSARSVVGAPSPSAAVDQLTGITPRFISWYLARGLK
jgi:hypothetical protein